MAESKIHVDVYIPETKLKSTIQTDRSVSDNRDHSYATEYQSNNASLESAYAPELEAIESMIRDDYENQAAPEISFRLHVVDMKRPRGENMDDTKDSVPEAAYLFLDRNQVAFKIGDKPITTFSKTRPGTN